VVYLGVGISSTNKRAFEVVVKVCVGNSDTRSTMRNILVRNKRSQWWVRIVHGRDTDQQTVVVVFIVVLIAV